METIVHQLRVILKNKIILFFCFGLASCGKKEKTFLLPNGDSIKTTSIKNLYPNYHLEYRPYEGFVAEYHDSFFKKMIIIPDREDWLMSDLNSEKIISLSNDNIKFLIFNFDIKDSTEYLSNGKSIQNYIYNAYKFYEKKRNNVNYCEFLNADGKMVANLTYHKYDNRFIVGVLGRFSLKVYSLKK